MGSCMLFNNIYIDTFEVDCCQSLIATLWIESNTLMSLPFKIKNRQEKIIANLRY